MVNKYKVAIMGRGAVSAKIIEYLAADGDVLSIDAFGSETGTVAAAGRDYAVKSYEELGRQHYDVLFGATEAPTVKRWFNTADADLFIDNSELFRLNPSVPLIVGRTNDRFLSAGIRIVSNPNCIVSMLARILYPLNLRYPLEKAEIVTYQSISGLGNKALEAYEHERDDDVYLDGKIVSRFKFGAESVRLYDNIVPFVGEEQADGFTHEEDKIDGELKKLIGPDFETAVMCARVPVRHGHSAYVHLTFKEKIDYMRTVAYIENLPTVRLVKFGCSASVRDAGEVTVTRVKPDRYCPFALMMFLSSDNLTVGSALNSYEVFLRYKGIKDGIL